MLKKNSQELLHQTGHRSSLGQGDSSLFQSPCAVVVNGHALIGDIILYRYM